MLGNPGMIRRTLKSDIQGEFDAEAASGSYKMLEVAQCAELRVNRFVAALARSDGPGTARIIRR
jgi:hypothetical protein